MKANLIAHTTPTIALRVKDVEGLIAYAARVSSPNQDKTDLGLLDYCLKHKHWSVFEMADAVMEIECPRDISRQLLRHRSFSFQEFSQRYSDDITFINREPRGQDRKNRQNSLENIDEDQAYLWDNLVYAVKEYTERSYRVARELDIAKECARVMLPEGLTMSKLYMKGSIRSWLHYLDVRLDPTTQKEHRELAALIKAELEPLIPTIMKAYNNE